MGLAFIITRDDSFYKYRYESYHNQFFLLMKINENRFALKIPQHTEINTFQDEVEY